jgi:hypothetical protein
LQRQRIFRPIVGTFRQHPTQDGKGFHKQYVRDHLCLRTETATNDVADYGVKKAVENEFSSMKRRPITV